MPSSGILRCVAVVRTNVLEELRHNIPQDGFLQKHSGSTNEAILIESNVQNTCFLENTS
jgi:hypothetical protein